jgi:hypothetical protein
LKTTTKNEKLQNFDVRPAASVRRAAVLARFGRLPGLYLDITVEGVGSKSKASFAEGSRSAGRLPREDIQNLRGSDCLQSILAYGGFE